MREHHISHRAVRKRERERKQARTRLPAARVCVRANFAVCSVGRPFEANLQQIGGEFGVSSLVDMRRPSHVNTQNAIIFLALTNKAQFMLRVNGQRGSIKEWLAHFGGSLSFFCCYCCWLMLLCFGMLLCCGAALRSSVQRCLCGSSFLLFLAVKEMHTELNYTHIYIYNIYIHRERKI